MASGQQVLKMTLALEKREALAICFRNLKGTKAKDLLLTARALKYLKGFPEFQANERLGEEVGVSGEIVRQFISLLDLPPSVQTYLEQRRLGLEQGRRLWQLHQARPSVVEAAARAMASMTAMESRDLVEYLIRMPSASVQETLLVLKEAKRNISHEYHVEAVLDENAYEALVAQARKRGASVNDLVSGIVNNWLEEGRDV